MKFLRENKLAFIPVLLLVIALLISLIYWYLGSKAVYESNNEEYIMAPKKYGVNEYSLVNIDNEQMANIYLNDYKNLLRYDISSAYNLLNSEYKSIKYPNFETFNVYARALDTITITIDKYSVTPCGEQICYYVYDNMNNQYIFRAYSVMEYEVYLDDYTVEI